MDSISLSSTSMTFFYTHVNTETALADLLYADLKRKKLVEEYRNLQQRSKKVLSNLNIPFLDSKNIFLNREDTPISIYEDSQRLIRSYDVVSEEAVFSDDVKIVSNHMIETRQRTLVPSFDIRSRLRPRFNKKVLSTSNFNSNVDERVAASKNYDQEEMIYHETIQHYSNKKKNFSFMIELINKIDGIIQYFIANKDEAFFYGILLALVSIMLSSVRKSRK